MLFSHNEYLDSLISRFDLSYVLPINAFSYVANAILANLLLHEQISPIRWLSTFIIFFGVLFVGLSKQANTQPQALSFSKVEIKSRHPYLFLLPLGLSISKVWLAVIALSLTDSLGDLFLAIGMKK